MFKVRANFSLSIVWFCLLFFSCGEENKCEENVKEQLFLRVVPDEIAADGVSEIRVIVSGSDELCKPLPPYTQIDLVISEQEAYEDDEDSSLVGVFPTGETEMSLDASAFGTATTAITSDVAGKGQLKAMIPAMGLESEIVRLRFYPPELDE